MPAAKAAGGLLSRAWRKLDRFLSVDLCPEPKVIYSFASQRDVAQWRVFVDAAFGGLSSAQFTQAEDGQKTAVFSGRYSKHTLEDSGLVRSGYCGVNQVRPRKLNLRPYDYLDFRVRGDGHTYLASIRLDQMTGGDEEVWQATLRTKPGTWEDVRLDFRDFIFTFRGRLVRQQQATAMGMPRHNIISFGVTMAASDDLPAEGGFRLELESIVAGAYELSGPAADRKAFAGYYTFRDSDFDYDMPRLQPPPISGPDDPRPH